MEKSGQIVVKLHEIYGNPIIMSSLVTHNTIRRDNETQNVIVTDAEQIGLGKSPLESGHERQNSKFGYT
jgi:hypothetical protein